MIVGVDVGTSITKASAVFHDGTVRATASRPSRLDVFPDGRVEQDLDDVVDSVASVVREIVASATEPVEAIAITGQGDGLWLRDAAGRAVRPPISWMDARGSEIVEGWRSGGTDSVLSRVYELTGSGLFPGCHAPLLRWLSDNEPESLEKAAVAGYCVDAVLQRLTGQISVDASDASLPFLDVASKTYVSEALGLCGVERWAHLLPTPVPSGTLFELDETGAELLHLPVGTPVTAGPYDLQACGFGSGTTRLGEGTLIVGTTLSCQVLVADNRQALGAEPAGMWLCTPRDDLYLRVMPSMVGTASLDWLLKLFGLVHADLDRLLATTKPGADGVSALTFFSSSGERAPFVAPHAAGQFSGLHLTSRREDMLRALCEGLAYAARHCFEELGLDGDVSASGGGLQSVEWASLFADVLGRPLYLPEASAVGSLGAAMVAWSALGSPVDDDEWRGRRRRIEPDPERQAFYDGGYAAYRRRLDAARTEWVAE